MLAGASTTFNLSESTARDNYDSGGSFDEQVTASGPSSSGGGTFSVDQGSMSKTKATSDGSFSSDRPPSGAEVLVQNYRRVGTFP